MFSLLQVGFLPKPTLTITLGGDVILGRDGQAIFLEDPWGGMAPAGSSASGSQNWFLVNLESPLGGTTSFTKTNGEGYNLCALADAAEILKIGGVDVVSVANNHQGDCEESVDPSQAIDGLRVVFDGQPMILETPAGTVAIMAVDAVLKPLDMDSLLASMVELKAKSDVLIVSLHWGVEYAGEPTPLQRQQAKQLANAGVDVLWGHHPHVLQPAEWVEAENGIHRMLALYSLGNLLADQTMTYETRHSAMITIIFKGGEISQLSFQPIITVQVNGELMLACPGEDEITQISERLAWSQLVESLP